MKINNVRIIGKMRGWTFIPPPVIPPDPVLPPTPVGVAPYNNIVISAETYRTAGNILGGATITAYNNQVISAGTYQTAGNILGNASVLPYNNEIISGA